MRRPILLALLLCLALPGAAAAAPTYTPLASNTTEDILAVEYQDDSHAWFTTSNGKIFRLVGGNWVQEHSQPGISFYDIEFAPNGLNGVAGGTSGTVLFTTNGGDTWSPATKPQSNNDGCTLAENLGDVHKVAFGDATTVFVFGDTNQVMRSTNSGANFANVNDAGASCYENYGSPITGAFFVPGAPDITGYVMTLSFGGVFFTADDFANVQDKGTEGPNGFTTPHKLAGDPGNPNRQWAVAVEQGGNPSYFNRTTDGWNNSLSWVVGNPDKRDRDSAQDIAFEGGTAVMVGNTGMIMNSIDGESFFFVDDPANPAQKWLSVGMASATDAIIGGTGGKLIRMGAANSVPDITAPTGLVVGPDTAPAGQPVEFTAQVADEPGGSGIDPGGFAWTSTGLPGASGQTASFTFPNPGSYSVRVTFRDLAGNTAEATKAITITTAQAPKVTFPTDPGSLPTATRSGGRVNVRVKGKVTPPAGRSCAGKMRITVKRAKKKIARKTISVKANCRYRKTIRIKRRKVKKARTLKVILQHLPAAGTGVTKSKIKYTTRIR